MDRWFRACEDERNGGDLQIRSSGFGFHVVGLFLLLLLPLGFGGCACPIRVPAIDPTGQCLLAPAGQSTTVAPFCGLGGCTSCLSGSGGAGGKCCCLSCLGGFLPEPAFREPEPPPPCLQGGPGSGHTCGPQCGPGGGLGQDECALGPPAVLIGKDGCCKDYCCLPKQGKRGRLMLSPGRVVAPVGGEVILLSGVCGTDGYLVTGEPIEWMLTPESVGHFIEIAPDDANPLQRLVNSASVAKVSGSFARGVTRTKPALITRGTLTPRDDVPLEAGQAWATISSPSEGVSRITALAPESNCWDQRKATTTIYWIDARWDFPAPQIAGAGSPVTLTSRVTRSEGTIPAVGWKVRYTSLNPELALFAPAGTPTAEVIVDDQGNATVAILPQPSTSGTATVQIEVIRPAQADDNMPALPLGMGQTMVTWSAPRLDLKTTASGVAGFDQPVTIVANVSNPGNLNTDRVEVAVQLPTGVTFISSDFDHRELGNTIVWSYDEGIPAGVQGDINLTVSARDPFILQFIARDLTNGLTATSEVRVDVMRPSLEVRVAPADQSQQLRVDQTGIFLIEVTNPGTRPLAGVEIEVRGDEGMIHEQQGTATVYNSKPEGLQAGETWRLQVPFRMLQQGERCVTATASASGQVPSSARTCVTVGQRIAPAVQLSADIAGRVEVGQGDQTLFRYLVRNSGNSPATNVVVTATFPGQLQVVSATQGFDASALARYQIKWTVPRIDAGQEIFVEGLYNVLGPAGPGQMIVTATSSEGLSADRAFNFRIVQPGAVIGGGLANPSPLTPAGPPPQPSNPLSGAAGDNTPVPPPGLPPGGAPPSASDGGLQVRVFDGGDPVTVGQEIRYTIQVSNRSARAEDQVQVRFQLGIEAAVRISQPENPQLMLDRISNGFYYLPEIRTLGAGQTMTYYVTVAASSPQTQTLRVESYSRSNPQGISAMETTGVVLP